MLPAFERQMEKGVSLLREVQRLYGSPNVEMKMWPLSK